MTTRASSSQRKVQELKLSQPSHNAPQPVQPQWANTTKQPFQVQHSLMSIWALATNTSHIVHPGKKHSSGTHLRPTTHDARPKMNSPKRTCKPPTIIEHATVHPGTSHLDKPTRPGQGYTQRNKQHSHGLPTAPRSPVHSGRTPSHHQHRDLCQLGGDG